MTGGVHEHMRAWEPEEDNTIIRLLGEMGPKWSRIVQQLPGRSVSSVRNRWQRIEKGRKLREAGHESKNRCQRCGHPKRGHVCSAKLKTRSEVSDTASITSDEVTVDLEVPLVRRASSDAVLFPSEAVAAACASPGMSTSGAMLSPASRNSGTVDGAVYGGAYRRFFPGEAAASAPAPILGRMKSEGRICSELGFEVRRLAPPQPRHGGGEPGRVGKSSRHAYTRHRQLRSHQFTTQAAPRRSCLQALAAAASLQLAAQAEATASILVPVHISKQMSATPAVPPLAAMPSLIHMSSYEVRPPLAPSSPGRPLYPAPQASAPVPLSTCSSRATFADIRQCGEASVRRQRTGPQPK